VFCKKLEEASWTSFLTLLAHFFISLLFVFFQNSFLSIVLLLLINLRYKVCCSYWRGCSYFFKLAPYHKLCYCQQKEVLYAKSLDVIYLYNMGIGTQCIYQRLTHCFLFCQRLFSFNCFYSIFPACYFLAATS
jgi:hypothetical protein